MGRLAVVYDATFKLETVAMTTTMKIFVGLCYDSVKTNIKVMGRKRNRHNMSCKYKAVKRIRNIPMLTH